MDKTKKLSFDELVALHRADPCAFETYRRETVQAEINKVPDGPRRRKLNALQWKLDVMKRRYKNPTAWNNQLHALMMAELSKLGAALKELQGRVK